MKRYDNQWFQSGYHALTSSPYSSGAIYESNYLNINYPVSFNTVFNVVILLNDVISTSLEICRSEIVTKDRISLTICAYADSDNLALTNSYILLFGI